MAKQLNADLDLLLDEEGFSDFQEEMVRLFQSAFTALSENPSATLGSEADRAASGLRALIPPEKIAELAKEPEGELQINELFQDMWRGLIGVATRIPHQDDQGHTLIIKTLQALRADSEPLWKDLYELSPMMRDKWIDPTFEWHPEEDDGYKLSQWLNLNSFVARLFGSGVFKSNRFPIWQLRQGLEDDLAEEAKGDCSPAEAVDNRVAVASEWVIHAGPALLRASLLESQDLDESLRRSYGAGVFFQGSPGFNIERWGFWKRRLGELRPIVSEEVALAVDRAIETMKTSAAALAGSEGNG